LAISVDLMLADWLFIKCKVHNLLDGNRLVRYLLDANWLTFSFLAADWPILFCLTLIGLPQ
jgi:hypothetical protein